MAGFLPFSIASIGATPHAATDAAPTPQTGAEGAFASVLAEMAGNDAGAETGGGHAGSAVQRLKLAFAASDARPATFDLGGLEVKVEGVRFVRSGDASAAEVNAAGMNIAGMNIAELARLAPQAGGKPEGAPTAEAQAEQAAQDAGEAGQPDQPLPLPLPLAERPKANAKAAEAADAAPEAVDAPVQSEQAVAQNAHLAALEGAAPKAAAPAAGFGVAVAADAPVADVDMAEAQSETESAPRDAATPRVNAQADSRPHPGTAAPGMTPPMTPEAAEAAQGQTRTQAHAAAATPVDEAVAATLAALAPAAGQARGAHLPGADGRAADGLMTDAAGAGLAGKPEAGDAQAPAQTMTAQTMTAQTMTDKRGGTILDAADKPSADPAAVAERARMAAPEAEQQKIDTGRIDTGRIDTARADAAQTAQSARPAAMTPEQAANQTATTQPAAAQAATTALPEGFQPLTAAPGLAQGHGAAAQAAQPAQPFGAEVVKAPTPQHLPEAMGLAISRHVSAEATEFTLRLDPAELGRVEVKLEMGKDGKATVSIQADNASTFDLLRRDSHALERALAEAGLKLDSGGLNFSLRQQDGQNPQQFAGEGGQRPATGRMQDAALDAPEQDNIPQPARRSGGAGLLDLSI